MSSVPRDHPPIPSEITSGDIIAIVSIYDPQAWNANQNTPYYLSRMGGDHFGGRDRKGNEGCYIFLPVVSGKPCYTFGRQVSRARSSISTAYDVYLPGGRIGISQFSLIPVWDSDIWRLQSNSETLMTVNGVPIQMLTKRTSKANNSLPEAIHLQQNSVNHVSIHGLRLDIWLTQTVREVYATKEFEPPSLRQSIQDVTKRSEIWAHDRYILGREKISTSTQRVVDRFTGKPHFAKLFARNSRGRELRDAEFLKMHKAQVDNSLVHYLHSIDIGNIPAIITDAHIGYETYKVLQEHIRELHPTVRFEIASKLLRKLFAALGYLHHHGILHGNVTKESVLLRMNDDCLDSVLLVDYSNTTSFPAGTTLPIAALLDDGRAAMLIIDNCCDIWQLRKSASKDAKSEEFMANQTMAAKNEYEAVRRAVGDFFETQGQSRTSEKGKKLLRLLELKQIEWQSAQDDQIHNARRREVGPAIEKNLLEIDQDWKKRNRPNGAVKQLYVILTLGHPWLDNLANQLYYNRWDTTPFEVTAKIKEIAGNFEDPWHNIEVNRTLRFFQTQSGIRTKEVLSWIASCSEIYSEIYSDWCETLEVAYERLAGSQNGFVPHRDVQLLCETLATHGNLPSPMADTLRSLSSLENQDQEYIEVEELNHIWYHIPSRMFNLTQLQRLASTDRIVTCINDGGLLCDNFIELRGEPVLQGCYASVSQLAEFLDHFGLATTWRPDEVLAYPNFDPADFSRVHPSKIVLARRGLLAYATTVRSGDQFSFHAPKLPQDVWSPGTFLPTFFGNMKVLPRLPRGVWQIERPHHWSGFKTAEQLEKGSSLVGRRFLKAKRPKPSPKSQKPLAKEPAVKSDQNILSRYQRQREVAIEKAQSRKRHNYPQMVTLESSIPKRARICDKIGEAHPDLSDPSNSFIGRVAARLGRNSPDSSRNLASPSSPEWQVPNNDSFYQHNWNTLAEPPSTPFDVNKSFTIAEGSFSLDEDWRKTEELLKKMPDEDDMETELQPVFGFQKHNSDESSTEEESDTQESNERQKCLPEQQNIGKSSKVREKPSHTDHSASRTSIQPSPSIATPSNPIAQHLAVEINLTPHRVILDWLKDRECLQHEDAEMPDTDVESFNGDADTMDTASDNGRVE